MPIFPLLDRGLLYKCIPCRIVNQTGIDQGKAGEYELQAGILLVH